MNKFDINEIELLIIKSYKPIINVENLFYKLMSEFQSPTVIRMLKVSHRNYYDFYNGMIKFKTIKRNKTYKQLVYLMGVINHV